MSKISLIILFLSVVFCVFSQETQTTLDVKITSVEKMREKLKNTTVVIYKNNLKEDSLVCIEGGYKLLLDTGNVYKIAFKKETYVTKYIIINTKEAPDEFDKKTKLKIDIGLFHEKENLNVDFLKKEPIGYARYDFVSDKMEWDREYLKLMKGKIIKATLDYVKSK